MRIGIASRVFVPLIGVLFASAGWAQQYTDLSLLQAMDQQSQLLYRQVAASVIRVQLPLPPTTRPSATTQPMSLLSRWTDKLSPEIRARLQSGTAYMAEVVPTSQPDVYMVRRQVVVPTPATPGFTPNMVGLVLDGQGHAILPIYVPPEYAANRSLPVLLSDGSLARARYIGSDRKARLTVIQVDRPGLRPAMLGGGIPADGSLVMVMSIEPSAARLAVWTRFADGWGVVARSDGAVAGFSVRGYFLSAAACVPVVRQLIEYGEVKRPRLGVAIKLVPADDPQRLVDTELGQTPAIRIMDVLPDSPAEKADLRKYDLILDLAGQPVGNPAGFAAAIAERRGATQLTIRRQDQTITVTVDLKE